MSPIKKTILILLSGALIAFLIVGWKTQGFAYENFYEYISSPEFYRWIDGVTPAAQKDIAFRLEVSASYCFVLQQQGKLALSELDECAQKYKEETEDIFSSMTKEKLGAPWSALSDSEKTIAVAKVKAAAQMLGQMAQLNKQMQDAFKPK